MSRRNIACVGNYPASTSRATAWGMIEGIFVAIGEAFHDRDVYVIYPKVDILSPAIESSRLKVEEFEVDLDHPERFAQWCARRKIHTVYFSDRPYYCRAYPFLKRSGVRKILMHDHRPGDQPRVWGLRRLVKSMLGRSRYAADYSIACSRPVLERLKETVCLPRSRTWLAENGIDLSRFKKRRDLRKEIGIGDDVPIIVSCSRATRYKGVYRIVEAATHFRFAHFVHIGEGPDLPNLKAQARKLLVEDRFTWLGAVPAEDVPGILMACDIAVHASDGEGLCLAILEFMAAGLPVVAPRLPTISQSVFHEETGLLYPPGSVNHMVSCLQRLIDSRRMRVEMGELGKVQVRNRYLLEHTYRRVIEIVRIAVDEVDAPESYNPAIGRPHAEAEEA